MHEAHLCPHLLYVLEHHIAVPVERLHASQKLTVVPAVDQDLRQTQKKTKIRAGLQCFKIILK